MTTRLIVNADDFGYARGVSLGIIECARQGVVTATGLLANTADLAEHLAEIPEGLTLNLGVHLTLTSGEPLSASMKAALEAIGLSHFPSSKFGVIGHYLRDRLPIEAIRDEWQAQIERCQALGVSVHFLNSHEHLHMFPPFHAVASELAVGYGIRHLRRSTSEGLWGVSPGQALRLPVMGLLDAAVQWKSRGQTKKPSSFPMLGAAVSGRLDADYLEARLPALERGGVHELMCHPGYRVEGEIDDPRLLAFHDWDGERLALQKALEPAQHERYGIQLCGYAELD